MSYAVRAHKFVRQRPREGTSLQGHGGQRRVMEPSSDGIRLVGHTLMYNRHGIPKSEHNPVGGICINHSQDRFQSCDSQPEDGVPVKDDNDNNNFIVTITNQVNTSLATKTRDCTLIAKLKMDFIATLFLDRNHTRIRHQRPCPNTNGWPMYRTPSLLVRQLSLYTVVVVSIILLKSRHDLEHCIQYY
jgi:hypothetical protein